MMKEPLAPLDRRRGGGGIRKLECRVLLIPVGLFDPRVSILLVPLSLRADLSVSE